LRHQAVISRIRRTHQDTATKLRGDASYTSRRARAGQERNAGRMSEEITPFRIEIPEADLDDLRRRLR
jgi:hypothetical protein